MAKSKRTVKVFIDDAMVWQSPEGAFDHPQVSGSGKTLVKASTGGFTPLVDPETHEALSLNLNITVKNPDYVAPPKS